MALITNEINAEQRNAHAENKKCNGNDPFAACDSFRLNHLAVRELKIKANDKGKIVTSICCIFI